MNSVATNTETMGCIKKKIKSVCAEILKRIFYCQLIVVPNRKYAFYDGHVKLSRTIIAKKNCFTQLIDDS